jgi:hypothetical protein
MMTLGCPACTLRGDLPSTTVTPTRAIYSGPTLSTVWIKPPRTPSPTPTPTRTVPTSSSPRPTKHLSGAFTTSTSSTLLTGIFLGVLGSVLYRRYVER